MPSLPVHDSCWWLTALSGFLILHLMAYAAWPWFTRLFASRADRGAGLAMSGGILIYLLVAQLLWRIGLLEMHFVWAALLMGGIGISGKVFLKPLRPSFGTRARMRKAFLQGWLIFSLLFWFWALIRSADPGVSHTEQSMDVMWMRAAATADQPPVRDAWFGGAPATYYSDGHQALAMLGTLMGLPVQESVNLMQIIWFALCGLLIFQAGKSLSALNGSKNSSTAGLIAMLLVLFVSTPQGLFSAIGSKAGWWWWKATRVIADGNVDLITEFPFFSFWLGDNHAHLIGLPWLLLAVISGIALLRARRIEFTTALLPALLIFWSWRINPWQVPTVAAIPLFCLLLRKCKLSPPELRNLGLALLPGLLLLYPVRAVGPGMMLKLNHAGHTDLIDFLKVFGFLLPGFCLVFIKRPHRLWVALGLLVAGMFLCTEIVYLNDAFQDRMNTVFKVYFQMWILIGLLAAIGWTKLLQCRGLRKEILGLLPIFFILPGLVYAGRLSWQALQSKTASLNAWSQLPVEDQQYLYVANALIRPGDRIAEAPGDSYDPASSRLGTWTAGGSLIGWTGHEQQWRPGQSWPDVSAIYEAQALEDLLDRVRTFDLDWIAVGPRERQMFLISTNWESWLNSISYRVVDQPEQQLYKIR